MNQFRELSSQFETFEIRKNEAYQLLKKYGDKSTIFDMYPESWTHVMN